MSSSQRLTLNSIGHCVVALVFVAMAMLQINDPDPHLWLTAYLVIGMIPAATAFSFRLPVVFGVAAGMVIAGLLVSLPGFFDFLESGDYASVGGEMSAEKPYIEPAREFLGIFIGALCLVCYRHRHRPSDPQNG